ncbi:hypothetical protein SCE1572_31965 [Sorangium cellulosum So0157-2]|uniref:Uncharacterized protein n=1 Tax=Sorangium cellulosum So0157-2 TaxID=1254432 RepID=S4Y2J1_SORCE|nr:hypothetical protein SCE1572_31965 [Sorangium cellulosum So0157-2]
MDIFAPEPDALTLWTGLPAESTSESLRIAADQPSAGPRAPRRLPL